MNENKKILQQARELCWQIEKLPASGLQTQISLAASDLQREIEKLVLTYALQNAQPIRTFISEPTPDCQVPEYNTIRFS